jgi:hypothetical protein
VVIAERFRKLLFMIAAVFIVLGLACISFVFLDLSSFLQITTNQDFSESSIIFIIVSLAICIIHLILSYAYTSSFGLNPVQIVLLPSSVCPLLFIVFEYFPLVWKISDSAFVVDLLSMKSIDEAVILVCSSSALLLSGMLISKISMLSGLSREFLRKSFLKRKLDVLLSAVTDNRNLAKLVIFSMLVSPFQIGWRLDAIVKGGREFILSNPLHPALQTLIPLAFILSTMMTMLAGFCYAKTGRRVLLWIVFADMLPRFMLLSRGFFIPIVLFILSATLIGKLFPKWLYLAIPVFSSIASTAALIGRGLSSNLASGLGEVENNSSDSIQIFFETNLNFGTLSQAVTLRDPSLNPINGFFLWLRTISPLPSFLGLSGDIPDVGSMLGFTTVGIPMPMLGDLYFQMGWLGLSMLFLLGWWMGRLEANIILHTKFFRTAYWPHILIWLSMFYGFIISFHSPSRASSRVLLYSLLLTWALNSFLPFLIRRQDSAGEGYR